MQCELENDEALKREDEHEFTDERDQLINELISDSAPRKQKFDLILEIRRYTIPTR